VGYIAVAKANALTGKPVEIGGGYVLAAVEANVGVALIVRNDEKDIWPLRRQCSKAESKENGQDGEASLHS
jgi:hypothetical protein